MPVNDEWETVMKRNELLFVYGTLQRGHLMHDLLRPLARYVGKARVNGRLYDVGGYPGLVLEDTAGPIEGELFHVARPGQAFRILDRYEGCRAPGAGTGEYRRVQCRVITEWGARTGAWVYEYAWPVTGLLLLAAGSYSPPKMPRRVKQALNRR